MGKEAHARIQTETGRQLLYTYTHKHTQKHTPCIPSVCSCVSCACVCNYYWHIAYTRVRAVRRITHTALTFGS
jgi:hypothetical protein